MTDRNAPHPLSNHISATISGRPVDSRSALREISTLLRGALTEELASGSLGPRAQLLLAQVLKDAHDVARGALNEKPT